MFFYIKEVFYLSGKTSDCNDLLNKIWIIGVHIKLLYILLKTNGEIPSVSNKVFNLINHNSLQILFLFKLIILIQSIKLVDELKYAFFSDIICNSQQAILPFVSDITELPHSANKIHSISFFFLNIVYYNSAYYTLKTKFTIFLVIIIQLTALTEN